jgi:hypothetical protein
MPSILRRYPVEEVGDTSWTVICLGLELNCWSFVFSQGSLEDRFCMSRSEVMNQTTKVPDDIGVPTSAIRDVLD